jgi:hypothetical protein
MKILEKLRMRELGKIAASRWPALEKSIIPVTSPFC